MITIEYHLKYNELNPYFYFSPFNKWYDVGKQNTYFSND